MKTLRRRARDHVVFAVLIGLAVLGLIAVTNELADKMDALGYHAGFAVVGAALFIALPFATRSERSTWFHESFAMLFAVIATLFSVAFLFVFEPLDEVLPSSERFQWPFLGFLVICGGFCVFIATPMSFGLYLLWLKRGAADLRSPPAGK